MAKEGGQRFELRNKAQNTNVQRDKKKWAGD